MFANDAGWGFGMGLGMWLFWILLFVLVVAIVKVLLTGSGSSASAPDRSPLEILKARYARGEIDEEEFTRRRHELEK